MMSFTISKHGPFFSRCDQLLTLMNTRALNHRTRLPFEQHSTLSFSFFGTITSNLLALPTDRENKERSTVEHVKHVRSAVPPTLAEVNLFLLLFKLANFTAMGTSIYHFSAN